MAWIFLCLLLCIKFFLCVYSKPFPVDLGVQENSPTARIILIPSASNRTTTITSPKYEQHIDSTPSSFTIPLHYEVNSPTTTAPRKNNEDSTVNENATEIKNMKAKRELNVLNNPETLRQNDLSALCNQRICTNSLTTSITFPECNMFSKDLFVNTNNERFNEYIPSKPLIENRLSANNIGSCQPVISCNCAQPVVRTYLSQSSTPDTYSTTQSKLSSCLNGITNSLAQSVCNFLSSISFNPKSSVLPCNSNSIINRPVINCNRQCVIPNVYEEENKFITLSPCQENFFASENTVLTPCTPMAEDCGFSKSSPYAKEMEELLKLIIITEVMNGGNSDGISKLNDFVSIFES